MSLVPISDSDLLLAGQTGWGEPFRRPQQKGNDAAPQGFCSQMADALLSALWQEEISVGPYASLLLRLSERQEEIRTFVGSVQLAEGLHEVSAYQKSTPHQTSIRGVRKGALEFMPGDGAPHACATVAQTGFFDVVLGVMQALTTSGNASGNGDDNSHHALRFTRSVIKTLFKSLVSSESGSVSLIDGQTAASLIRHFNPSALRTLLAKSSNSPSSAIVDCEWRSLMEESAQLCLAVAARTHSLSLLVGCLSDILNDEFLKTSVLPGKFLSSADSERTPLLTRLWRPTLSAVGRALSLDQFLFQSSLSKMRFVPLTHKAEGFGGVVSSGLSSASILASRGDLGSDSICQTLYDSFRKENLWYEGAVRHYPVSGEAEITLRSSIAGGRVAAGFPFSTVMTWRESDMLKSSEQPRGQSSDARGAGLSEVMQLYNGSTFVALVGSRISSGPSSSTPLAIGKPPLPVKPNAELVRSQGGYRTAAPLFTGFASWLFANPAPNEISTDRRSFHHGLSSVDGVDVAGPVRVHFSHRGTCDVAVSCYTSQNGLSVGGESARPFAEYMLQDSQRLFRSRKQLDGCGARRVSTDQGAVVDFAVTGLREIFLPSFNITSTGSFTSSSGNLGAVRYPDAPLRTQLPTAPLLSFVISDTESRLQKPRRQDVQHQHHVFTTEAGGCVFRSSHTYPTSTAVLFERRVREHLGDPGPLSSEGSVHNLTLSSSLVFNSAHTDSPSAGSASVSAANGNRDGGLVIGNFSLPRTDDPLDHGNFTIEAWILPQIFNVAVPGANIPADAGQSPNGISSATHQLFTFGSKYTEEIFIEIATQPLGVPAALDTAERRLRAYRISGGSRTPQFGVVAATFETNDITSFCTASAGAGSRWIHICLVYSFQKWQLLVNGQLVAETSALKKPSPTSALDSDVNKQHFYFDDSLGGMDSFARAFRPEAAEAHPSLVSPGIHSSVLRSDQPKNCVLGKCFAGSMAEVRVWSVARAIPEVRRDMHRQLPLDVSGLSSLIGYFPLDEQCGLVVTDCSGNGGHALLVSSAVAFLDILKDQQNPLTVSSTPTPHQVAGESLSVTSRTTVATASAVNGVVGTSTSTTTLGGPHWLALAEPLPVVFVTGARYVEDFVPAVWASNSARDIKTAMYHLPSDAQGTVYTLFAVAVPVDSNRIVVFEYCGAISNPTAEGPARVTLVHETVFEPPTQTSVFLSITYRTDAPEVSNTGERTLTTHPVTAHLSSVFYSERVDRLLVGRSQAPSTSSQSPAGSTEAPVDAVRCLSVVPLRRVSPDEGFVQDSLARIERGESSPHCAWSLLSLIGACSERALHTLHAVSSQRRAGAESLILRSLPALVANPSGAVLFQLCALLEQLRCLAKEGNAAIGHLVNSTTALLCLNMRLFCLEARRSGLFSLTQCNPNMAQISTGNNNNTINTFAPMHSGSAAAPGRAIDPSSGSFYVGMQGGHADCALAYATPCEDATQLVRRIQLTSAEKNLREQASSSPLRLLEWLAFAPLEPASHHSSVLQFTLLHESFQLLITDRAALDYIMGGYRSIAAGTAGPGGAGAAPVPNSAPSEDVESPEVVLFLASIRYFTDPDHLSGVSVERVLGLSASLLSECVQSHSKMWNALQQLQSGALLGRVRDLSVGCLATTQQVLVAHLSSYLAAGNIVPVLRLPSFSSTAPMSPSSPVSSGSFPSPKPTFSSALGNVGNPAVAVTTFLVSVIKTADGLVASLASGFKKPITPTSAHHWLLSEMHLLLTKGLIGTLFPMLFVMLPSLPLPIIGCVARYLSALRDSAVGLLEVTSATTRSLTGNMGAANSNPTSPTAPPTVPRRNYRVFLQPLVDFVSSLTLVWTQTSCALLLPQDCSPGLPSGSALSSERRTTSQDDLPLGHPHDRLFRGGLQKKGTSRDAALKSLLQGVGVISRVFAEVQSEHVGLRAGDKSLLRLERLIMAALCSALLPTPSLVSPAKSEFTALFEHVRNMRPWVLSERQKNPEGFSELIEAKATLLCSFEPCIVDARWPSFISPSLPAPPSAPETAATPKPNSVRLLEIAKGVATGMGEPMVSKQTNQARDSARKWRKTFAAWKAFRQLRSLVAMLQGSSSLGEAEAAQLVARYLNDSSFTPSTIEAQLLNTAHLGGQKLVGLLGVRQLLQEHRHGRRINAATLSLLVRSFCGWHYQQRIAGCPNETLSRVRGTAFQLVEEAVKEAGRRFALADQSSASFETLVAAPLGGGVSRQRPLSLLTAKELPEGPSADTWLELALSLVSSPWEVADFSKLPVSSIPQLLVRVCQHDVGIGRPRLNHSFPPTYHSSRISSAHSAHSIVLGPSGLVARGTGLRGCCVMPLLWDAQYHAEQQKMLWERSRAVSQSPSAVAPLPIVLYYEVTIVDLSANASVGIGVGPSDYNLARPPGWDARSFALHDDGVLFAEGSTGRQINATIGLGDVIGCGYNTVSRSLFFTKNGRELGVTVDLRPDITSVCPLFGFDAKGLVKVNFGAEPFVYELMGPKGKGRLASLAPHRSPHPAPRPPSQRAWDALRIYAFRVCQALATVCAAPSPSGRSAEEMSNADAVEMAMRHTLAALSAMLDVSSAGLARPTGAAPHPFSPERLLTVCATIGHVLACFPRATPDDADTAAPQSRLHPDTISGVALLGGQLLGIVTSLSRGAGSGLAHGDGVGAAAAATFAPTLTALKAIEIALQIVSPSMAAAAAAALAVGSPPPLEPFSPQPSAPSAAAAFCDAIALISDVAARSLEARPAQQAVGWWIVGMLRRINSSSMPPPPSSPALPAGSQRSGEDVAPATVGSAGVRCSHPWADTVHRWIVRHLREGAGLPPQPTNSPSPFPPSSSTAPLQLPPARVRAQLLLPLAVLGAGTSPIPLPGDAVLRRPKLYHCGQVLSYLLEDEVVTVLGSEGEDATAAMVGFDFTAPSAAALRSLTGARHTMSTARVRVAATEEAGGHYAAAMAFPPSATADVVTASVLDTAPDALAARRRLLTAPPSLNGDASPAWDVVACPNHLPQLFQLIETAKRLWGPRVSVDAVQEAVDGAPLPLSKGASSASHGHNPLPPLAPSAPSSPLAGATTAALPHTAGEFSAAASTSAPPLQSPALAAAVDSLVSARLLQALWLALQALHEHAQRRGDTTATAATTGGPIPSAGQSAACAAEVASVVRAFLGPSALPLSHLIPPPNPQPSLPVQICALFCHAGIASPGRGVAALLEESAIAQAALQEQAFNAAIGGISVAALSSSFTSSQHSVGVFGLGSAAGLGGRRRAESANSASISAALGGSIGGHSSARHPLQITPASINTRPPSTGGGTSRIGGSPRRTNIANSLLNTSSGSGANASQPLGPSSSPSPPPTHPIAPLLPIVDEATRGRMAQELSTYGFPFPLCVAALEATSFDFGAALQWLLAQGDHPSRAGAGGRDGGMPHDAGAHHLREGEGSDEDGGSAGHGEEDEDEEGDDEEDVEEGPDDGDGDSNAYSTAEGSEDGPHVHGEGSSDGEGGAAGLVDGHDDEDADNGDADGDGDASSGCTSSRSSVRTRAYEGFALRGGSYVLVTAAAGLGPQYSFDIWLRSDTVDSDQVIFRELCAAEGGEGGEEAATHTNGVWFTIQGSVARFGLWDAAHPSVAEVFPRAPDPSAAQPATPPSGSPSSPAAALHPHAYSGRICEVPIGTAELGRWTHYTCVQDGPDFSLFINGALRSAARAAGGAPAANLLGNALCVGGCPSYPERSFSGEMKALRLFDTALSATAVAALHSVAAGSRGAGGLQAHIASVAEQNSLAVYLACDDGKFPLHNSAAGSAAIACSQQLVGDLVWRSASEGLPSEAAAATLPEVDFTTHGDEEAPYTVDAATPDAAPSVLYRQLRRMPSAAVVARLHSASTDLCTLFAARVAASALLLAKGGVEATSSTAAAAAELSTASASHVRRGTETPPPAARPETAVGAPPAVNNAGRLGGSSSALPELTSGGGGTSAASELPQLLRALSQRSLLRPLVRAILGSNDVQLVALLQQLLLELITTPVTAGVAMMLSPDGASNEGGSGDFGNFWAADGPIAAPTAASPFMTPPLRAPTSPAAFASIGAASPSSASASASAQQQPSLSGTQLQRLRAHHPISEALAAVAAELLDIANRPQSVESFESSHPCRTLSDPPREVSFPKQQLYDVFFDQRGSGGSVLTTFYSDLTLANIVAQHSGYAFRLRGPKFVFDVRLDGAVGPLWGYKMSVVYNSHQQLTAAKLLRMLVLEATTASVIHHASLAASGQSAAGGAAAGPLSPPASGASPQNFFSASPSAAAVIAAAGGDAAAEALRQPTFAVTLVPVLLNTSTANALINATRVNVGRARRCLAGSLVKILRFPRSFLLRHHQQHHHSLTSYTTPPPPPLPSPPSASPTLPAPSPLPHLPDLTPLNDLRRQLDRQFRKELGLSIHSRFVQSISRLMLAARDASLCWSEEVLARVAAVGARRVGAAVGASASEAHGGAGGLPLLSLPAASTPLAGGPQRQRPAAADPNDNDYDANAATISGAAATEGTLTLAHGLNAGGGAETEAADEAAAAAEELRLLTEEGVHSDAVEDEARFQQLRSLQRSLYADRITDGHERISLQRRALPERVRIEPNGDKTVSVWCEHAGGAVSANVAVGGGRWYYEVRLISSGDVTIGIAAAVGAESSVQMWGLNGRYGLVTTPNGQTPVARLPPECGGEGVDGSGVSPFPQQRLWKSKDTVGVIIDADKKELRYLVNGVALPYAVRYSASPSPRGGRRHHRNDDESGADGGASDPSALHASRERREARRERRRAQRRARRLMRWAGSDAREGVEAGASDEGGLEGFVSPSSSSDDSSQRGSSQRRSSGVSSSSPPSSRASSSSSSSYGDGHSSSSSSSSSPPGRPHAVAEGGVERRPQGATYSTVSAMGPLPPIHQTPLPPPPPMPGMGMGMGDDSIVPSSQQPLSSGDASLSRLRQPNPFVSGGGARGRGGSSSHGVVGGIARRGGGGHTNGNSHHHPMGSLSGVVGAGMGLGTMGTGSTDSGDDDGEDAEDYFERVFGGGWGPSNSGGGRGGWRSGGGSGAASADFQPPIGRYANGIPPAPSSTSSGPFLGTSAIRRLLLEGTLGSGGPLGSSTTGGDIFHPPPPPPFHSGAGGGPAPHPLQGSSSSPVMPMHHHHPSTTSATIDAIMESIFSSTLLSHRLQGGGPSSSGERGGGGGVIPHSPFAGAGGGRGGSGGGSLRSALDLAFSGASAGMFGGSMFSAFGGGRGGGGGVGGLRGGFGSAYGGGGGGGDRYPSHFLGGGGGFYGGGGGDDDGYGGPTPSFPLPRVQAEGGEDGGAGFSPWLVFGSEECAVINFGARYFEHELPHEALPLDRSNLGVGSLIPFNQLRAFDDVAAAFALQLPPPPFFVDSADPTAEEGGGGEGGVHPSKGRRGRRDGPAIVGLRAPPDVLVSPTEVRNDGLGFATAVADCGVVGGGRWYYEATLTSAGLMQIGWCEKGAAWGDPPTRLDLPAPPEGAGPDAGAGAGGGGLAHKGVGDTATSFAIDLFRMVVWVGGVSTPILTTRRWAAGDIVGCCVDLDARQATFTLNGRHLAQLPIPSPPPASGSATTASAPPPLQPLAPAVSLRSGNGCIINFGTTSFRFKPEGYSALGIPDTWAERIDTYYSTVSATTGARRLLRLERSAVAAAHRSAAANAAVLAPETLREATASPSTSVPTSGAGGGGEAGALDGPLSSPFNPLRGYVQPHTSALSLFVTPSKPLAASVSPMGSPSPSTAAAAGGGSGGPSPSPPLKVYSTFVAAVNEHCAESGKEESQFAADALVAAVLAKVPSLRHYNCARLLLELRNFARVAKVAIPMLPFDGKGFEAGSSLLATSRMLLFATAREALFNVILKETNSRAEHFRLTINRNHAKAAAFRAATATGASTANLPLPPLSTTVFGQTVMLLGEQHPRIFKTSKRFWTTSFAGEGAEDAGGPFRAHINDICAELMSGALPLFVPTANNVHNIGEFREAFVPAAGAVGLRNAALFRFVGRLMGGCVRSGEPMGVYFPPIFWKKLARSGAVTLADVAGMDKVCVQCVSEFATMRSQYGDDVAAEVFDETFSGEVFVTRLSDGTAADLVPNGSAVPVTFDRCEEYARGIANARLREFDLQIDWIREGFLSVVPEVCLALLTPRELELRVCGKADYTVAELREGATFEGLSSEDRRVKFLWSALEAATPKQRRLFLKFVSGRERMPVKLRVLPLVTPQSPDAVLPRAATCFFAIELPDYSTAEIMAKKLIYSIENCAEIDTDFRARDVDIGDGPQLHIGAEDRAEEDLTTAQ